MIKETMAYLSQYDPEVGATIENEYHREQRNIELIASENIVSPAVMLAMGTCLTNKYAEGYPGKRYYGGCYCVDETEEIARQRACKLFGAEHANVQPHSGASANLAAFKAMLQPGDTYMGMNLAHGGHLSHGSPVNISGQYFHQVPYSLNDETEQIDYDELYRIAQECKPKMILAGASAYPRKIDVAKFREIAEAVGLRDHLVSRAVNEDVARDVGLTYDKTMEFCRRLGRYSISPGNFVGGLTTIEEKSMGAVVKMGGCRIEGVLKIAQRPKHPGFWLLDVIPDDKPEPAFFFGGDATGLLDQIACGCHLVLFNTGRGHVGGTPVAPILKLTGNQETFDMLSHDIDFCAGSVLTGAETKAEAAERLWGLIQRICNGEQVHAERVGHRQGTLFFNYQDPRRVVPCRY